MVLTYTPDSTLTYQWNDGSSNTDLVITETGTYTLSATSASNCTTTDTVYVEINSPPSIAQIISEQGQENAITLFALGVLDGVTYQWNFGDGNSSNEATPTHTYENGGDYEVILIVSNNCGTDTLSQRIHFSGLGISTSQIHNLKVFPNPAQKLITFSSNDKQRIQSILIYNGIGQIVINRKTNNQSSVNIAVSNLVRGIYHARVLFHNGETSYCKFEVRD